MKFDYTFITLFGFTVYEPMVLLTNSLFLIICAYCYKQLSQFKHPYVKQMSWFILLLGTSSMFGATEHAVHYQLGYTFFNVIYFIMTLLISTSIYFCFRAAYTFHTGNRPKSNSILITVLITMLLVFVISYITKLFLLMEILGGLALIYSLIIHSIDYRQNNLLGSRLVVVGIIVSFVSIISHLLKISLHEWFNHKDISHVIMICSLVIIYKGVSLNAHFIKINPIRTEASKQYKSN